MRPPVLSGKSLAAQMIDYAAEIRRRFGNVRRARGCWLYTEKNVRLLDMFLDGGAAVLGRRCGGSKLVLKNMLDRGLSGSLPTGGRKSLTAAVCALFGGTGTVSWFCSRERACKACASAGIGTVDWRPWDFDSGTGMMSLPSSGEAVLFTVPFPWGASPEFSGVIVFVPGKEKQTDTPCLDIPDTVSDSLEILPGLYTGDSIPPQLLPVFARSVYDLHRKIPVYDDNDFSAVFHPGEKSLWIRKGAYLTLRKNFDIPIDRYYDFFCACLDRGVLVSPSMGIPSIIPLPCIETPQEKRSVKTCLKKISFPSEEP